MSYNNILCPIHKSPIGGVCNEISCKNKNHLLCMNCVSNANSCIRKLKHEFIPFDEFIIPITKLIRYKFCLLVWKNILNNSFIRSVICIK